MFKKWVWQGLNCFISWRFPQISHLTVTELNQWLKQPEKAKPLLLDARTTAEYKVSHLPQAYPMGDLFTEIKPISLTPDAPIVIYCSIGYRSALAVASLQQSGYHRVFNLNGSLFHWVTQGYPVYRQQEIVHVIHPYNWFWKSILSRMIPEYNFVWD